MRTVVKNAVREAVSPEMLPLMNQKLTPLLIGNGKSFLSLNGFILETSDPVIIASTGIPETITGDAMADQHLDSAVNRASLISELDKLADLILIFSPEGQIFYMNKPAIEVSGIKPKKMQPVHLHQFLSADTFKCILDQGLPEAALHGSWHDRIEIKGLRNTAIPAIMTVLPFFGSENRPAFFWTMIREEFQHHFLRFSMSDERKSLEERMKERTGELRATNQKLIEINLRLEEANKHRSRFLSTMSHELRTPLTAVLGFIDLLKGRFFGDLNEKQAFYIDQIETSGKHLLALINDLLDIAKIDAGAIELELTQFSFGEVIDSTVSMLSSQFRTKQLSMDVIIPDETPMIAADKLKIKQVLLNLLSNAWKYTPEGGSITLSIQRINPSTIQCSVTDTGIGMDPKEADKVFSEFYQADRIRDNQMGGTGIGLALTRRLVELHGGEIGVRSQPGIGSTFWFNLPLKRIADHEFTVTKSPGVTPIVNRRILVVEDNEINISMIVDMLSLKGHEVLVARNGKEGIDLAVKTRPDLIFMDMRMPIMDGIEATQLLRKIPEFADTPIIALTASAGIKEETRQLEAGCTAHLSKPIQSSELFSVINAYLGS
ncbi:response regulator [bacterium]|nr:response regulator [candidate division CSSED10-310 bacterium]